MNLRRISLTTAAALLAVAPLSACGADAEAPAAPAAGSPRVALSITDPWVKAAESGTTAVFGTLVNRTGEPVTVVSGSSPVAGSVELHEVVAGSGGATTMRAKPGGFTVPAGGSHRLAPGGDHIMLMDLKRPVEPGAEIPLTLRLSDGATVSFTAVAKEFSGAKESYDPSEHHDHG
ncbi:copper chaperone PCu(A)C [Thermomonospora catenispora]|uniref:copper chaperone PCu(A)C n=1 Tax=Thermomonospora catenispora TaxID=2493090 RepID=UPI00111D5392|nr:copper chaperone PCu(A)C [Thermomonospora catenispora]TNY36295.1 copper chaperone PCu(A)C [Thermomonospora catenispora]